MHTNFVADIWRWIGFPMLLLALLCGQSLVFAAEVESLRVWRSPDKTRLVFDLSSPVTHKIFQLDKPNRIVIDVASSNATTSFSSAEFNNTPIKSIRSATRNKKDLRIVLDLSAAINPRSFLLAKNEQYGDRLVIDLYDKQKAKPSKPKTADKVTQQLRDIVVAIDAGHGGEDPGALGKRIREKNVVLAISKELNSLFKQEKGYRPVLIRKGDYYIPLRKRTRLARKQKADLYVSIHADAFTSSKASGSSVFALSSKRATSETARYLAQRENRADLIGGDGGVSLSDMDDVLAGVLLDLSMTASLSASLDVGGKVLQQMGKMSKLHSKHIEQAGFAVLKSPDMPSILVETGFISNPKEAKLLNSKRYQRKMARAIFNGVTAHFSRSPPPGTYLAWRNKGDVFEYVVVSGDTLSQLAARFDVSMNAVMAANRLKSSSLRIGQKLTVPVL